MNVEVFNEPNCITNLRVQVPKDRVEGEFARVTGEFARLVRIPGYRPGKVPVPVVASRFKREIREEVERALVRRVCREAIAQKGLRVLQVSDISEVEMDPGTGLRFSARLVTAPQFELPDYRHLPVKLKPVEVSDAEVDEWLEALRASHAEFEDVSGRGLEMEDVAVIDYHAHADGRALDDIAPKALPISHGHGFWLRLTPDAFLPGFAEKLLGATPGEEREFDLKLPDDFPVAEVAGLTAHYRVAVEAVKRRVLPELGDAFAAEVGGGKTLADLRADAAAEVRDLKEEEARRRCRQEVMEYLLSKAQFELPDELVQRESRRILVDIVRENQARGVSDGELKEKRQELIEAAGRGARDRVRGTFLLTRIAEAEKIEVTARELETRVRGLSLRYDMPYEKLVSELEKRDAIGAIEEELLVAKTLDFLVDGVSVASGGAGQSASQETNA